MSKTSIPQESSPTLNPSGYIIIKGARVHNLQNIDVNIPRNKLVVVTGVSGSGKSSLVFDTLYAEGQRRYVESLSAYARQFMGKMNKPDVDYIKGISPAMAIEQKVNTRNPRSTVGTSTEIYDYLKLLFARTGHTFSPVSGKEVKRHTVADVLEFINSFPAETRIYILVSLHKFKDIKTLKKDLELYLQKGFTRVELKDEILKIEDFLESKHLKDKESLKSLHLLIDRFTVIHNDEDHQNRIADSVQTSFQEGEGACLIKASNDSQNESMEFSSRFELDGISFEIPSTNFFSFNNPYGACKTCEGFGSVIGIDEDLVIPDKSLSIYEGAVAPWRGEKMSEYKNKFVLVARKTDFPIHRSYYELTEKEKKFLWEGNLEVDGLNVFFKELERQTYKIQYRVMLSKYRGKTTCPDCKGTRLRKDASYVKLVPSDPGPREKLLSITDILLMSVDDGLAYFNKLQLQEHEEKIAKRILLEVNSRLGFLHNVGLGYLSLNRLSNSLSGGETQRINLATSLGSSLVGSLYILDEPSIGLHPRDTQKLITVLENLRNIGNTVIVVEHEEDIMKIADQIIDIGPLAGVNGGKLIAQGTIKEIQTDTNSLTGKYLSGVEDIPVPFKRRKWSDYIEIVGARQNNLKNIDVKIPLHVMTVVTGVSGSGKTSLIKGILYPALQKTLGNFNEEKSGSFDKIGGDFRSVTQVEMVDQNPIGKSSRSNPVTYIKAYDPIRELYASQAMAKARTYKPQHFSFNVEGGRCDNCQGEGEVTIEMQFMADIHILCEVCNGSRFKEEILEVKYKEKSISDILNLSVDEAIEFFHEEKAIISKIKPLAEVGLGYIRLGQSSSTLSGGEAQRIKLASFLGKGVNTKEQILFIFDEPTTGLHFHDIKKLLKSFEALIQQGNSVLIIEHNMEVIKCADWILDLGPEGGNKGGNLVYSGIPEDLINIKESYTGRYLREKLKGS